MIITCPYCQTRYQVAAQAIGAHGRKVQCAECSRAWRAAPVLPDAAPSTDGPRLVQPGPADDVLFDREAEAELDAAFEREAARVLQPESIIAADETAGAGTAAGDDADAPVPGRLDPALMSRRRRDMLRRQRSLNRSLPFARLRRWARIALVAILVGLVAAFLLLRTEIVRVAPSLAGVYAAMGLPVNVVGLEFADIGTMHTMRDGALVMVVTARIASVASGPVNVPSVIVSLLDAEGRSVYEWTVTPDVRTMLPGDFATIETRLLAPPAGADRVRLSFAGSRVAPGGAVPTNSGAAGAEGAVSAFPLPETIIEGMN